MLRLLSASGEYPRWQVLLISLASVALVGVLDHLTGPGVSVAILYLFPIGLAAWSGGMGLGALMALFASAAWLNADQSGGGVFGHGLVPYWNALVRLGLFLIVAYLLTRLRTLLKEEAERGRTDSLTGLLNRRAFAQALDREIERARRYRRPFTAAYIDLDDFKRINDVYGHAVGDAVLKLAGDAIRQHVRATDLAGRLGGDEFAAVFIETEAEPGLRAATDLARALEGGLFGLREPVTFSVGAVTFNEPPADAEAALGAADAVMYTVKRHGKHAVAHQTWPPAQGP